MVSVLIPLYNQKKYICDAVSSALAQKTEMEIIVIDDASSDRSAWQLLSFLEKKLHAKKVNCPERENVSGQEDDLRKTQLLWAGTVKDTPVFLYRNKSNLGVAKTRNLGVLLARGEYIAFLDADDLWQSGKLKKQLSLLKKSGAILCNTGRRLIYADGEKTDLYIGTPVRITLRQLKRTNLINLSSVLVRREVMTEYPMQNGKVHEDYLTWLLMLKKYKYAVGIDEPLIFYRLSKKGRSRNKIKAAAMTYRTYRRAGFGKVRSLFMMVPYTYHGLRKYRCKNMF